MAPVANTTNLKTTQSVKVVAPVKTAPAKSPIAYHQVDNTFRLTTPENISFEYQLAGPFRRLFPYILDILIVLAAYAVFALVTWIVILIVAALFAFLGVRDVAEFLLAIAAAVALLGSFLAYWFYGCLLYTSPSPRDRG